MYHALIFLLFIHQPPQTGGNNSVPPAGNLNQNQQPQGGNISSGQNAMVDGVYTILAYEKYGRPVMASNTIRVVIRNNILSFPGDAKMPGKMIQLTFGPNNTVTTTPMDGTVPLQNQNQNQTNQQVPNDPLRNNLPGSGTTPRTAPDRLLEHHQVDNKVPFHFLETLLANAQGSATGETTRQAAGTPPLNNGQMGNNQGTGSTVPQNNNGVPNNSNTQNNNMQNYPGVESGVYVQSNEFLSICITSRGLVWVILFNLLILLANQLTLQVNQSILLVNRLILRDNHFLRNPLLQRIPSQASKEGVSHPSVAKLHLARILEMCGMVPT